MSLCLLYRIFVSLLPYLFIYNLHLSPNNLFFCIHVDSFMLYVPKQQSRCVFLQQRESKLLSNTGHAAEITEQLSVTASSSPTLHTSVLYNTHHNEQTQNLLCKLT